MIHCSFRYIDLVLGFERLECQKSSQGHDIGPLVLAGLLVPKPRSSNPVAVPVVLVVLVVVL